MRTFTQLFRRQERRRRQAAFLAARLENRRAWLPLSAIEDLSDPQGKRFLFEAESKTAQHTFSSEDGPSRG